MAADQGQLTSSAAKRYAVCHENGWGGLNPDKKKAEQLIKEKKKDHVKVLLGLIE